MVLGFFRSLKRKNGKLLRIWERVDTCVKAKPSHSHRSNFRE